MIALTADAQGNDITTQQGPGECPILHLELGPLDLDLLGNLLGNLLCAIVNLLNPPTTPPLANLPQQIINLLDQLLQILR